MCCVGTKNLLRDYDYLVRRLIDCGATAKESAPCAGRLLSEKPEKSSFCPLSACTAGPAGAVTAPASFSERFLNPRDLEKFFLPVYHSRENRCGGKRGHGR